MATRKGRSSQATTRAAEVPTRPLGKLERYSVRGLFGVRDIAFDLEPREPTLLTGVNGTGKSTVLRTIDAVSTASWSTLFNIPFHELKLIFSSGRTFSATQAEELIGLSLTDEDSWAGPRDTLWPNSVGLYIDETWPAFNRLIVSGLHTPGGRTVRRVQETPSVAWQLMDDLPNKLPEWTSNLPGQFPVLFITDQRLVIEAAGKDADQARKSEPVSTRVAAEDAALNISNEIKAAQAEYASTSQTLDQSSPQRVIKAMRQSTQVGEEELLLQLEELSDQRRALQRSGLLPKDAAAEFAEVDREDLATPHIRAYISTYVTDIRAKLSVLEPLRRRLTLFSEFLTAHYRRKSIAIDQRQGFIIKGAEGPVPPARLSSGEQQILVLAHHILFKAAPETLVLIDEPELSLHVTWQSTLVDDLAEMGRERDLSFLLATHSPTLLAGREDLKRSLDE